MQAVTRAFNILSEVTGTSDGKSFAEVVSATGLPLATCHRLLGALTDVGLISRDAAMKRFYPGPALIRLAAAVWSAGSGPGVDLGLAKLRDRWQECFFIASVIDDAIVCTRSAIADEPTRMSVSVPLGRQMNPHAAASCKAILAFRPEAEQTRFVAAAGGLIRLTDRTITDSGVLGRELAKVPARGYAVCDQEAELGVAAFAVPVILAGGVVESSLGVVGPRDRLFASRGAGMIDEMLGAAESFAELMGESRNDSAQPAPARRRVTTELSHR